MADAEADADDGGRWSGWTDLRRCCRVLGAFLCLRSLGCRRPSDLLTIRLRFGDDEAECCWLATQAKHCSATTESIGFNGPLNYADGNLVSICFVGGEGKTVSPNA